MTPVLTEEAIRRLPDAIVEKLRSLISRIRRVLWWRGVWYSLAALLAALLAVMAIDAAFDLESVAVRCALSLVALLAVGAVTWRSLVRPLSRTFGLAQVARLVEIHHPEMHERISTAVELLGSKEAAGLRGSDELLAEVVKSAVVDVGTVSPEKEYSSLPMRWPRRLAVVALAVLAGVLAIWPFQGGMLVARALLPFANIGSASAFDLRVITQDAVVGEDDPLTILVAAKGRAARRVELRREMASSPQSEAAAPAIVERLMPQTSDQARPGETVFALTLPAVQESFRYAATAGRARSRAYFIEVQKRPDITGLSVTYTFPAYTGRAPRTDPDSLGDIAALVGTRVDVTATLSRPAVEATVVYDQTENAGPPVELAADNGAPVARWSAELTPGTNYRWTIHSKGAGDRFGKPAFGTLRATDDLPPAVVIDSPVERELRLRPNDLVPIVYTAADDFGFSAVDLMLKLDGTGVRILPAPLPDKLPDVAETWRGTATLDLSALPLVGVREVRVTLRVTDTLPPDLHGPQTAVAEDIIIRLDWGADTFAHQTVRLQEDQLRRELEQVKNDLNDQRRRADEQAWQLLDPDNADNERFRALEKLTENTATTAARLEDIARRATQSAFAERADDIEQAAREQVRGATEALQSIPQSDRPDQRSDSAERASNHLATAARQLDDVLNSFRQDRQQGQELGELASLAREQQQLADQAAQASPPGDAPADPTDPTDPTDPAAPPDQASQSLAATPSATPAAPPSAVPPSTAPSEPSTAPPSAAPTAMSSAPLAASAATPPESARANPLTDPSATPQQRAEAFERWQEWQDSVEHRAQNVTNQFQQRAPADRQADLVALAAQVQELARQADALAARQEAVAAQAGVTNPEDPGAPTPAPASTLASTTPEATAEAAEEQAGVASLASELAESVESLQQSSARTLRQNSRAQTQAEAAATALEAAADSGREASRALAEEASQASTPNTETGDSGAPSSSAPGENGAANEPSAASEQGIASSPAGTQPAAADGESSQASQAQPSQSSQSSQSSQTASAEAPTAPTAPGSPGSPAAPAAASDASSRAASATPSDPTPGQQAVAQTSASLQAAAAALNQMAEALAAQSEGIATASQALTAAASQTRQASDAGDAAREAGNQAARQAQDAANASAESVAAAASAARLQALAESAATPAQQAATNLALAAATAQASMGLPENALDQQNMGRHGSPKPGDGPQGQSGQTAENSRQSNQPGQEATDKAGLQTTKDYGLPPELAKLGLTPDDWTRLRSLVTSGSEGAGSDQVPADYRDLVRGYFRALATGAAPPAGK